jgi:hypothetical protein
MASRFFELRDQFLKDTLYANCAEYLVIGSAHPAHLHRDESKKRNKSNDQRGHGVVSPDSVLLFMGIRFPKALQFNGA